MNIALINPTGKNVEKQMPLGLGYIASYCLANNTNITIRALDLSVEPSSIVDDFLKKTYDIVGISITSLTYKNGLNIATRIRDNNPDTLIVFGGPHVSIMKEKLFDEPIFEIAVYGEGEITFNEIINSLKTNNYRLNIKSLYNINGLVFRDGKKVVVTNPREWIKNLDSIPFPAFQLFAMEKYDTKYPIITSRGCPFSCVFCASSQIWGRRWRARTPENIIEEIKYIKKKYPPRPIDFHDDGFNMSLERVNKICDLLIENKIKIPFGVRGLRADKINLETAKKMRYAGCTHVAVGVESANRDVLKKMRKGETIEQISEGVKILKAAGIDVIGQFMIGNPGDNIETIKESINFAKTAGFIRSIFGTAVPFPGTDLWNYVEKEGKFLMEKNCTLFEEKTPRIIFETSDFTFEQRLQALHLAQAEGMIPESISNKNTRFKSFRDNLVKFYFKSLYKFLPETVYFNTYFILRRIRAVIK